MAGRTGVALRDPLPWHDLVLATELIEGTGYETLFVPEISGREGFAQLAGLARATISLRLATGVLPLTSRALPVTAMGAATVAELSRGRFILGLGAGTPGPGTLQRLRDAVSFLRKAFVGQEVNAPGEEEPFQLSLDVPEAVPIWLAALGPKTMRLAGEVADGVLLNWCTPERVRFAATQIREGAERAGRDPSDVTIAVYTRACVGQEPSVARELLRVPAHDYLSIPHYRGQFEQEGIIAAGAKGDRAADAIIDAVCLPSDVDAAPRRLDEYRDAGADIPVVYPVPNPSDPASSLTGTILALAPHPAVER